MQNFFGPFHPYNMWCLNFSGVAFHVDSNTVLSLFPQLKLAGFQLSVWLLVLFLVNISKRPNFLFERSNSLFEAFDQFDSQPTPQVYHKFYDEMPEKEWHLF